MTAVIRATRDGSRAYWEWVAAGEKHRIAKDVLRLGLERRDFLEEQINAGEKKAIDRVDNRRIVVSREAKVVDAHRKLQQAAAKLSLYLRSSDGQPLLLTGEPTTDAFCLPTTDSLGLEPSDINFAHENRPELSELRLVSQQLDIALRQASNEVLPEIDAGLLFGQDIGEPSSSKRDKSEFEIEAKLLVSIPLERRKAFGKIRQLRGKLAQVRAKQRLTLDKISIEVRVARAALEAALLRVEQTTEGLELAKQMNVAERRLYEAGQSELFNLNIREKQTADAALERIDALRDYNVALADYAAALGLETNAYLEKPDQESEK
jgi:outer membrane protein TolC